MLQRLYSTVLQFTNNLMA